MFILKGLLQLLIVFLRGNLKVLWEIRKTINKIFNQTRIKLSPRRNILFMHVLCLHVMIEVSDESHRIIITWVAAPPNNLQSAQVKWLYVFELRVFSMSTRERSLSPRRTFDIDVCGELFNLGTSTTEVKGPDEDLPLFWQYCDHHISCIFIQN